MRVASGVHTEPDVIGDPLGLRNTLSYSGTQVKLGPQSGLHFGEIVRTIRGKDIEGTTPS